MVALFFCLMIDDRGDESVNNADEEEEEKNTKVLFFPIMNYFGLLPCAEDFFLCVCRFGCLAVPASDKKK